MGLNFSFFRTPKHRVFNYQPLYYDERKEALQERIARAKGEAESKNENYVPGRNIRHNFRKSLYESRKNASTPAVIRLIVLLSIVVLMVALYYVFQSVGLLLR